MQTKSNAYFLCWLLRGSSGAGFALWGAKETPKEWSSEWMCAVNTGTALSRTTAADLWERNKALPSNAPPPGVRLRGMAEPCSGPSVLVDSVWGKCPPYYPPPAADMYDLKTAPLHRLLLSRLATPAYLFVIKPKAPPPCLSVSINPSSSNFMK